MSGSGIVNIAGLRRVRVSQASGSLRQILTHHLHSSEAPAGGAVHQLNGAEQDDQLLMKILNCSYVRKLLFLFKELDAFEPEQKSEGCRKG